MVVTFILLALCVSSNANPAAPAPSGYNGPPPEGQCPNDWWKYAGDLCIQLDHEPDDFEGALMHCKHWEDHSAAIEEFLLTNEDWSLLLTVERLNYLNSLPKKPFNHKIWLNAIWFESKWYQIVRYHHNKNYREHIEDGDAVLIASTELDKLAFEDKNFDDGDSLIYDHWHNTVFKRWNGYNGKFSYVCTHRKEYKDLINVDVKVVDENDDPLPAFLWVEDKSGTWLAGSNGEYQFKTVELGTKFRFTAGFSPNKDELVHKDVTVEAGIAPIKIQLKSGKVIVQFKVLDENDAPIQGAKVAINGDPAVDTGADGLIPPTPQALPCGNKLDYVVEGPPTKQYQSVTDTFVVAKTSDAKVMVEVKLVPVPAPVYADIPCTEVGTLGNWKIYIYEKNAATDDPACALACNGVDAASAKKCDFYIFKDNVCWLGDFANASPTYNADVVTDALEQPVDIKLKQGPLGDGTPAYSDHKEECGLVGTMMVATAAKDATVASESECAARCALGCTSTCQGFKYDPATQDCNYINWARPATTDTYSYTPYNFPEANKLQTLNGLEAIATAVRQASDDDGGSRANIAGCWSPDGNAIVNANVDPLAFNIAPSVKCNLVVHNPNPGKKVTLSLPKDFGGGGTAGSGGLNVFVGTWDSGNIGVSLFSNDLSTALTGDPYTVIEWYAPIVTIQYESTATSFLKVDAAKIEFEA